MEKHPEDRIEPEVEVGHESEHFTLSSRQPGSTRRSSLKRLGLVPSVLVGLVILALGLWIFLPPGILSIKKQGEFPEVKTLKEEVQKLGSEISPLKKDIQSLQAEQKTLQEQLAALKENLKDLAKKTETLGEKKTSPKTFVYKIQKGDTLSSIAKKFQVRPEDIRRWNHFTSKSIPKPGKRITVYLHTDS